MTADDRAPGLPDLAAVLGRSVWTVPALLQTRAETGADAPALWSLAGASGWQPTVWRGYLEQVRSAASGMRRAGLAPGDRVGILAPSCVRWDIAQIAAMAAGGVVVGLDPHDTSERLGQVAAQCGLAAAVVQDEGLLRRLPAEIRDRLRFIVMLGPVQEPSAIPFDDLVADGRAAAAGDWDQARPDDDALIVFTSGTTGEPKGIAYTHRQVCGAVASILQAFPDIEADSRLACWLPLSNLFQRMINLCAIGRGAQTYYVEDPRKIMQHVAAIAPHLFIGVPRFYEKLHAGIVEAIEAKPSWQQGLARWAIRAGDRRARSLRDGVAMSASDRLFASLAENFVLRRVRGVMGGNLRYLISGSAPMPLWLLERFHALGFLVLEAYGMSESIVPVAANRPRQYRFGSVGQPMAGSEVKLAPDGELLLRGPGVFGGYLGEAGTGDRLDADGFLASGDYASIDANGFVTLHGRKSEIFKTSTGRRVFPGTIESRLRQVPYVEHAAVFGANRARPVALVSLSQDALARRYGAPAPIDDLLPLSSAIATDVRAAIADLPGYMHPEGLVATTRQFTPASGELTTNLKLRRAVVQQSFTAELNTLMELLGSSRGGPNRQDGASHCTVVMRL